MEQPNMMAGGMPGQGNPLMNNPNNTMQRPQGGNIAQQLHAKIIDELRNNAHHLGAGWQAMLDLRERGNRIMQLITQLRQINSDVAKCFNIAVTWEAKVIQSSATKEQYIEQMAAKMRDITAKRQQAVGQMNMPGGNMGMMPNNMMNMQNGMMAPNMQNNGMGNMNFPNGGNMGMQGGRMQQGQNPMAQLQRQMQASPLPMQQQPNQAGTLDPSALQMPQQGNQQQPQQPPNQQGQNMGQPNQPQQPNMNQGGQAKPNQQLSQEVFQLAKQMSERMPVEQKNQIRARFTQSMTDAQRAHLQQTGTDPMMKYFISRAQNEILKRQQAMGAGGAMQNKPGMGNANNMNMGNMGNMGNNAPQRPPSQTSGQNIDFSGIMGQQANALKLQDAGEQVVPASNNNNGNNNNNMGMGMGNSMNMPQNINPQMLGNNNQGQGNGQLNPQQMQLMMMQQRAHNERLSKQMMAQQHALASRQQHSQLQGQPGGLHTPNGFGGGANGQVNSPAMSMLNRPMAPPGQTTPGTPQPNRQQQMPSTPMNNGVSQLQQHHQNMVNQNSQQQMNQAGQNTGPGQSVQEILQRVPAQLREKLSQMPPEQARSFLQKWHSQMANNSRAQGQQGMANGLPNGMNMGPPQQGNLQQPGMPQNMGNAIPGFNSQPPPNQMNMDPAAQLQQRMHREQQLKLRTQAMDMRPFPKPILTELGIAVPQQVQLWGHLKQHVQQNSPQGTIEKVNQQQQLWFQQHPQEFQSAMGAMMQRVRMNSAQAGQQGLPGQGQQHPSQQNGMQPPASMPDRPAPPAQMVPPAPMMQPQGPGMQPGANQGPRPMPAMPTITPQDLAVFRTRVPQASNMSDDQIRNVLVRQKIDRMRQQQQMQRQSLQTAQMQKPPGQTGAGPPSNSANMGIPQQRTPQPPTAQPGLSKPNAQPQGNNDVVDISSQPPSQNAPQAPPMQASQSQTQAQQPQAPFKPLTKEQVQQLSEKDRLAYLRQVQATAQKESLRKAQGQMGGAANGQAPGPQPGQQRLQLSSAIVQRIKQLQAEVTSTFKRSAPVHCDAPTMEKAKIMLKKLYHPLQQISGTFGAALNLGFPETTIKSLMRAIIIVTTNAMDSSGNIKDYLSVTVDELTDFERLVAGYMTDLKRMKQQNDSARQQVANMQGQEIKPPQAAPAAGMARTASQQNHARKASVSNKAPPAPTDNKPFDWAAPSPHGVPKYELGRNELTPDKLKFPPQKKRKTDQPGSQGSTPAAQAGTPGAATASPALAGGKMQSPEQTRKTPAQLKAEAEKAAEQKKFRCNDNTCEAALHGFDTEEQLKQHQESQHQPIADPLTYLLEQAAAACGVDQKGKTLQKAKPATSQAKARPTPKVKGDAKKQQAVGGVDPISGPRKPLSLSDAMLQKLDLPIVSEETTEPPPNDEDFLGPFLVPEDDDECRLLGGSFKIILGGALAEGYREDPNESGLFTLRPGALDADSSPELTPPSEGSQSSQNSDVSQNDLVSFKLMLENMDADLFGDGTRGVPEGILPLYEQMENFDMVKEVEDTQMINSVESKGDGEASKKRKAPEMWQLPAGDFMDAYYDGAN